jgi:hypothetical protein
MLSQTFLNFPLGHGKRLGQANVFFEADCMLERYIPAHCTALTDVSGAWKPQVLIDAGKIEAWWCGDDVAVGAVTNWVDRIGGLTMTQATTANKPTCLIGPGGNWLGFDGVNDYLAAASIGTMPSGNAGGHIFMAVDHDLATINSTTTMFGYGSSTSFRGLTQAVSGATHDRFLGVRADPSPSLIDTGFEMVSGPQVIDGWFHPGSISGWVNANPTVPPSAAIAAMTTGTTSATVGTGPALAAFSPFRVRHIFVTDDTMTPDDRMRLQAWTAWDMGLPGLLPYDNPFRYMRP